MNNLLKKRASLERFVREQLLGPGINGYRFVDTSNAELVGKTLVEQEPINYDTEILNIVPAAIYSTGILFPEDRSGTRETGVSQDGNEVSQDDSSNSEKEQIEDSLDDIEAPDNLELNQMFPLTMGMTCCLEDRFRDGGSLEFKISFRYYQKIKNGKESAGRYGLLCETIPDEVIKFLQVNNLNHFRVEKIDSNYFIFLSTIQSDELTIIRNNIRDSNISFAKQVCDESDIAVNEQKIRGGLSSLKLFIYNEMKNSIDNAHKREQFYNASQRIELCENITKHLTDLLDARDSRSYGLWKAEKVTRIVKIENIKFKEDLKKIIFLNNKENSEIKISILNDSGEKISNGLRDIFRHDLGGGNGDYASLSANIQLSRDTRKKSNEVFLKIQLLNTSTPFNKEKQDDGRYYSTFNEIVNKKSFFGVSLSIEHNDLIPYNSYSLSDDLQRPYSEDEVTKFVYNQYRDYAVGHGCSVKWTISNDLKKVETEYIPTCEVPDIDPTPRDKSKLPVLSHENEFVSPLFLEHSRAQEFKWLSVFSDANNHAILEGLNDFVNSYGKWISIKKNEAGFDPQFASIKHQELNKCQEDYDRMKFNIKEFLSGDNNMDRLESFRLMNSVMFMQLWHSVKTKSNQINDTLKSESFEEFNFDFYKSKADDKLYNINASAGWRAFQLAFILLNLDGIFKSEDDANWERRNNWVDLVWFPTGGGKTEAYLGLIALTIINRRREFNENGGGTAVIMRYTLRLLTMQQFQRASLVIMALELVRRWSSYGLGEEPITIGLWVGNNSLPNKNEDLKNEFGNLNSGKPNRIPFDKCPWCASDIVGKTCEDNDNKVLFLRGRLHLKCRNAKCAFHYPELHGRAKKFQMPIPVCLSDETIYMHPPSLLFGTVDKFAQLAHKVSDNPKKINEDSRRLFGKGNWEVGKPKDGYLPPELIIQDELHLLLGPLGSSVALFESAIDQLCARPDGTRPKIISSTATTRNTQLQIAALFDRKVNLFPKPGVECDDSFFAFYRRKFSSTSSKSPSYLSKRKYIGLLPTGRTQIWMQMRLIAVIMAHRAKFELEELGESSPLDFDAYKKFEKSMDYFHTTISYFNSLREVGKTQSQIQSYILKELRRVFSRVMRPAKLMHALYTFDPINESELTGRLSGEEVTNELSKIETKWAAKDRFASSINGEIRRGKTPPELVIATNMISVGIDVSRFNTIIMNSMPRNTAEYIQASSRVARDDYGLVFTIHHPFRARDVSHYEKFIEFHEKMYSYVEPISITPFTNKSVERYLGLYVATIIRHKTRFSNRESAIEVLDIEGKELKSIISKITNYFENRKEHMKEFDANIQYVLKDENVQFIKLWVKEAFNEWINKAENSANGLVFNNAAKNAKIKAEQLYIDIEEYDGNFQSNKWQIPMSLRVVEPEAAIKIGKY